MSDITATQPEQNKSFYRRPIEGVIISVTPAIALVQPIGSFHAIPCKHDLGAGTWVGKRCTVAFIPQRKQYVIQSVFSAPSTVASPDQNPTAFELSPPSNLVSSSVLSGCVLLTWDCPPQQDITFQVQWNTSASDSGASNRYTRGGQLIIEAAATTYFRLRSITIDWHYSSWTDWGNDDPGA